MGRIQREQLTIDAMLAIYCADHHAAERSTSTDKNLCADCRELQTYAHQRLDNCPFQDAKPACNLCEVHCYSAKMQQRIKAVMRYAGPRMPLRHPMLALWHMLDKLREVPQLKRRQ